MEQNFNEIADMTAGIEPSLESYEHELQDRTFVLTQSFQTFIIEHPALQRPGNENLVSDAGHIAHLLGKFYQDLGDLK